MVLVGEPGGDEILADIARFDVRAERSSKGGPSSLPTIERDVSYDPTDSKINDFTASYANLELDSGEKGSYLQTGGDGGSPIKRLVCSVTQATFGDGTTWVAGGKYHGKLLPFATTSP